MTPASFVWLTMKINTVLFTLFHLCHSSLILLRQSESPVFEGAPEDLTPSTFGVFLSSSLSPLYFGGRSPIRGLANLPHLWRLELESNSRPLWELVNGPSAPSSFVESILYNQTLFEGGLGVNHGHCFYDSQLDAIFSFGGVALLNSANTNALMMYNFTTRKWSFIGGSPNFNDMGSFGLKGVPDASNLPSARDYGASFYHEQSRSLFVFGGYLWLEDVSFADLWKYDVGTGNWVWLHGSDEPNADGVFGVKGVGTDQTHPPGLCSAAFAYARNSGIFYIHGGYRTGKIKLLYRSSAYRETWTSASNHK